RFPENIRLFGVFEDERMIAGTVLYITHTTVHAQYIASDAIGREKGALALLFHTVIEQFRASARYFDFGTSNEDGGLVLNAGLIRQKCGFGARAVAFNTYKVSWL
ncbi:MAG: GNAT family N-acetyltransferase, partial [Muribaculaceae bacterium]|nr:GNAT family N-acetyltransferase [Muribaculaceae bacterium]